MFENKNILVLGLARSGLASAKALYAKGAKVTITDMKMEGQLGDLVKEVSPYTKAVVLGEHPENVLEFDLAVVSPGIPLDIPYVEKLKTHRVPVIGELELAFLLTKSKFVGITGTNGKTTTTALLGAIYAAFGKPHFVVGNIGLPAVTKAIESDERTTLVTEVSSFQLETIHKWTCHIGALLNITPDHLNRHKTMDNYIAAKLRLFENQSEEDWAVLNYDDPIVRKVSKQMKGKVVFFSREHVLEEGAYIEDDTFKIRFGERAETICGTKELFVVGSHNESNALAASLMAYLDGIKSNAIADALKTFKGVEHRIEYVDTINGRVFYNDSKATNPESAICALKAMVKPTHLIAGGMDKGSDFQALIEAFGNTVVSLALYGQTRYMIEETARMNGFSNIQVLDTLDQAVQAAYANSNEGEAILLSPACASWDMYKDFEERGRHFKECARSIRKEW